MDKHSQQDNTTLRQRLRQNERIMRVARALFAFADTPWLPPLPRFMRTCIRPVYTLHFLVIVACRWLCTVLYRNPVFQSRCAAFGKRVVIAGKLPYITGPVRLDIGDDVYIGGNVTVLSSHGAPDARLVLKDRSSLGWNAVVVCNKEVVIEEDVRIPHDVRISDSDGHPREADLRRAGRPQDPADWRAVRICRDAWIGNGTHIMKGVTIGEGAVIGANSVVISNVPAYALAMGNPAEVLMRGFGRPTTMKMKKAGAASA